MTAALPTSSPATRLARAMANTTAVDVAFRSGLSLGRVKRLAGGQSRMMVEDVEQLALVLGVSPCWLAFGVGGMR